MRKIFTTILLITVAVFALLAVIFLITMQDDKNKEDVVEVTEVSDETKATINEPEGLTEEELFAELEKLDVIKTPTIHFKDDKYGFSIKYPEGWVAKTIEDYEETGREAKDLVLSLVSPGLQLRQEQPGSNPVSQENIAIYIKPIENLTEPWMEDKVFQSLEEYFKYLKSEDGSIEYEEVTISGFNGYRTLEESQDEPDNIYYFEKDGLILTASTEQGSKKLQEQNRLIVESFEWTK